jgi:hypothetical protein
VQIVALPLASAVAGSTSSDLFLGLTPQKLSFRLLRRPLIQY